MSNSCKVLLKQLHSKDITPDFCKHYMLSDESASNCRAALLQWSISDKEYYSSTSRGVQNRRRDWPDDEGLYSGQRDTGDIYIKNESCKEISIKDELLKEEVDCVTGEFRQNFAKPFKIKTDQCGPVGCDTRAMMYSDTFPGKQSICDSDRPLQMENCLPLPLVNKKGNPVASAVNINVDDIIFEDNEDPTCNGSSDIQEKKKLLMMLLKKKQQQELQLQRLLKLQSTLTVAPCDGSSESPSVQDTSAINISQLKEANCSCNEKTCSLCKASGSSLSAHLKSGKHQEEPEAAKTPASQQDLQKINPSSDRKAGTKKKYLPLPLKTCRQPGCSARVTRLDQHMRRVHKIRVVKYSERYERKPDDRRKGELFLTEYDIWQQFLSGSSSALLS